MGEWILLICGTLFFYACLRGIVYLFDLRRKGLIRTKSYNDPAQRFSFLYPEEWDLETREGKDVFITHDHDGKLSLITVPKIANESGASEFLETSLKQTKMEFDEFAIHHFEVGGRAGAYLESRATNNTERLYLQEWVVDDGHYRLVFSYRCSVLYGLVDGHFIDQLVKSIQFEKPAEEYVLPRPRPSC